MRKLIVLSLALLLCLPLVVYAASMGGAETQGQGKFAIGMDQEFVFDRDMELKSMDPDQVVLWGGTLETKPEIDSMYRTMVKANYGVLDNLDIYVKLGTADFKGKMPWTWTEAGDWEKGTMKIEGDNAFAYGFGAKGTYNLKNDWIIGCDVQYLRHKNDYKGIDSWEDSTGDSGEESFKGNVTFQEWQVAPYIAKKIGNFVPYLGVKYSDLRTKFKVTWKNDKVETWKIEADDNVGVFLGTDYKIGENWKLNLEGRFVDETAMSLAATYKF